MSPRPRSTAYVAHLMSQLGSCNRTWPAAQTQAGTRAAAGAAGRQPRSARRDQQAVKLQSLFPAEQVDLFRPECAEFASCLRGLPELAGDPSWLTIMDLRTA